VEEFVRECVEWLTSAVLQVGSIDQWVWHLHSSVYYSINSAYDKLTEMDINDHQDAYNFVWLKEVPLKVFYFFLEVNP